MQSIINPSYQQDKLEKYINQGTINLTKFNIISLLRIRNKGKLPQHDREYLQKT